VVGPVAAVVGVAVVGAGRLALRARNAPSTTTGLERFVGQVVAVQRAQGHGGQALLEGAWWHVRSDSGPLSEGQQARVVAVDGLDLVVVAEPSSSGAQPEGES
jgi:membrane-bound serine protease (ClpP class)